MKRTMKAIHGLLVLAAFLSAAAWAKPPKKGGAGTKPVEDSKRSLDFDGEVIEGMNRQPLDSLTQLSEGDGAGSKKHLYRRGKKFNEESQELAREQEETY